MDMNQGKPTISQAEVIQQIHDMVAQLEADGVRVDGWTGSIDYGSEVDSYTLGEEATFRRERHTGMRTMTINVSYYVPPEDAR